MQLTKGSYYKRINENGKTIHYFLFAYSETTGNASIFDTQELRDHSIQNIKELNLMPSTKTEFEIALNSEIANLSYSIAVMSQSLAECHQMREILKEGYLKLFSNLIR
jgi:hypothetical protein